MVEYFPEGMKNLEYIHKGLLLILRKTKRNESTCIPNSLVLFNERKGMFTKNLSALLFSQVIFM